MYILYILGVYEYTATGVFTLFSKYPSIPELEKEMKSG